MNPALLLAGLLAAGPVSQSGFAGAGGLLIVGEPGVEVLRSRTHVRLDGDDAVVRVAYLLRSSAARSVRVSFPAAVRPTESDGPRDPPVPWKDVVVRVAGKPVPTGTAVEPEALGEYVCGDPVPGTRSVGAVAHLVRARVDLAAGVPTEVELSFRAPLAHDDWMDRDGGVERSLRQLCVRPRPLRGFAGAMAGMFQIDLDPGPHAGKVHVTNATPEQDGSWHAEGTKADLMETPDLVIQVDR